MGGHYTRELGSMATREEAVDAAAATRTERRTPGGLQRRLGNRAAIRSLAGGGPGDAGAVQQVARAGVEGGGAALPHLQRIQRAFGAHDVGGVRAHLGDRAARASRAIGAEAYTLGQRVAFASAAPGLHLAAHEAAHAVQQRAGVRLRGGVGAVGDVYERHADAVAARVVRGESAEALLSTMGGGGADGPAVQRAAFDRPVDPAALGGWDIDHDEVAAQEIPVLGGPNIPGHKTTRLTALVSPVANIDAIGGPTVAGYNPLGWAWIEANEARTRSGKIRYYARFHLLSAKLGGDGRNPAHLTPTDKSTNSGWETEIENGMKRKIKGAGDLSNPTGVPIYYDVNVSYWTRGDAPATYDLSAKGGVDFSDNIELFPRQIDATWASYERGGWVAQPPASTGVIPKPAGVGGSQHDLVANQTNFTGLSSLYGVDNEILAVLVRDVLPNNPRRYGEVRAALEDWVTQGVGNTNTYVSRANKLFQSDGKLRRALAGNHPQKLTLAGHAVADDNTPEAREFDSPVAVRNRGDFGARFNSKEYTFRFSASNVQTVDPIRGGYVIASRQFSDIPRARDVLVEAVKNSLNGFKVSQMHEAWEFFVDPDENERLPPMIDNAFAGEGEQVAEVLFAASMPGLEAHVTGLIGFKGQPTGTDACRLLLQNALGLGAPGGMLAMLYWNVLLGHRPGAGKDYLTIEHAEGRSIPKLWQQLEANEPALAIFAEGQARVNVVRRALVANLPLNGTTFPSLGAAPWNVPLTTPIADTMDRELAKQRGKQRDQDNTRDNKRR